MPDQAADPEICCASRPLTAIPPATPTPPTICIIDSTGTARRPARPSSARTEAVAVAAWVLISRA
jgi:hypothetical protein